MREPRYYIYAITTAAKAEANGSLPSGLEDQELEIIPLGPIAAVVSPLFAARVRPQRKSLAAHHGVLKALGAEGVLPMKFGMIADDREELESLLEDQAGAFADRLERFAGRVEMTLKVKWDVENIFIRFVERYAELREARDEMLRTGEDRDTQMEVGELFTRLIGEERDTHAEVVIETLAPASVEVMRNDPRSDEEAVSVACLVDRNAVVAFENAIEAAAEKFDDEYLFEFGGPHPPHSFATDSAGAESRAA